MASSTAPRRGYETVTVAPIGDGFGVHLDSKPLRTPAGTALVAPRRALAEAIATEWRDQGTVLDLSVVPLTRLLGTALDRVPQHRAALERELIGYAETELVCHRAEHPAELAARQRETWQPLLDWLTVRFDAPLATTNGVVARKQPDSSLAALARALTAMDRLRLVGLSHAVGMSGSLVIGLAVAEGRLDAAGAFAASELDASYQIERWGEDAEAASRRRALRRELDIAVRWFALLEDGLA